MLTVGLGAETREACPGIPGVALVYETRLRRRATLPHPSLAFIHRICIISSVFSLLTVQGREGRSRCRQVGSRSRGEAAVPGQGPGSFSETPHSTPEAWDSFGPCHLVWVSRQTDGSLPRMRCPKGTHSQALKGGEAGGGYELKPSGCDPSQFLRSGRPLFPGHTPSNPAGGSAVSSERRLL